MLPWWTLIREGLVMQYYLDGQRISEQRALDLEAAGIAHVIYGSSGGNTPDGSGEPWIRMAPCQTEGSAHG